MTSAPSRRWRRLEPDERRGQILDAAIQLFGERPYASVSTSELARAAGVTRGLLHHYFGTKRDLYLEVVRTMMFVPNLEALHLPEGSARLRTEAAIDWLLDVIESHGQTWIVVSGAEGIGPDPEVQALLDEADDRGAELVLQSMGFTGSPAHRDAAAAAVRCFAGMIKSAGREWLGRRTLTRSQVHRVLSEALLALLQEAIPALDEPRD